MKLINILFLKKHRGLFYYLIVGASGRMCYNQSLSCSIEFGLKYSNSLRCVYSKLNQKELQTYVNSCSKEKVYLNFL